MVAEPQETTKQKIIQTLELAGIEIAGDPITNVYPTPRASGYWTVEAVGTDRHVRKQLEDAGAINILGMSEEIDGRDIAVMRFTPDFLGKPVLQVTDFTVRQLPSLVQSTEKVFAPFVESESDDDSPRNDLPIPPRAGDLITDNSPAKIGDPGRTLTPQEFEELKAIKLPAFAATDKFAQTAHDLIKDMSAENAQQVISVLRAVINIVNGGHQLIYSNGSVTVVATADYNANNVELSKARATVGRLNMDVERLKSELESAKNRVFDPGEVGQLRKQITQLQNDLQLAQNRPAGKQLAEAQRESMNAKNEIIALKRDLENLKIERDDLLTEFYRERKADDLIDSAIAEVIARPMSPLIVELEIYDTLRAEERSATNKQIAQRLNSGQHIAYEQLDFISGRLAIRWEYRHEESAALHLTDAVAEAVAPDEVVIPAAPLRPSPFTAPIMPQSPLALRPVQPHQNNETSKPVPTHAQLIEALKSGAIDAAQYSRTANALAMYNVTSKG